MSAQFPLIDKMLTTEDFTLLNHNLKETYAALERLSQAKGGMGKTRDVKKAMIAIEKASDLIKELLKVKYAMASGGATPQKKNNPGEQLPQRVGPISKV